MKTFKIKDLNVSIDTNATITQTLCANPSIICNQFSYNCGFVSHCHGCSIYITHITCNIFSNCGFVSHCGAVTVCACSHIASIPNTTTWVTTTPIQDGIDQLQEAELGELKKNLGELQKAVDVKLQRTPEELDQLEAKLTEALEEVRSQKGNAKKK